MWDPQSTSSGSIMPGYKWLIKDKLDISNIEDKMRVMQTLGVPYTEAEITNARNAIKEQAQKIEADLTSDPDYVKSYENSKKTALANGVEFVPMYEREIVAMIAYIQRLGTDIKVKNNTK